MRNTTTHALTSASVREREAIAHLVAIRKQPPLRRLAHVTHTAPVIEQGRLRHLPGVFV